MRRATFCKIVNVDGGYFKSLRQRAFVPFVSETEMTDGREWQRFTLEDALLMRLALDLAEDGGMSPEAASNAVRNGMAQLRALFADAFAAAGQEFDVFIGIERWRQGETLGASHYAGTLADIAKGSEERAARDAEYGMERTRLTLANVSRAARFIMKRAMTEGLTQ